ncbi:hypothetical protein [Treponema endosymbiont of Eucomonympha sp.]|uniref:hypothetical protein n=1 Tax=Treponema endosymbiont of Eucomonympha sp. TaxID=1580831 RepID=UPI001396792D|nr:hypothetical protein [Treponema endosymbiont of Eucomonympha sp.]
MCLSHLRRNHYAEFAADLRLAIEFVYANLQRRKEQMNGIEAAFFVCVAHNRVVGFGVFCAYIRRGLAVEL